MSDFNLETNLDGMGPVPGLVIKQHLMELEQKRTREVGAQFKAMEERMNSMETRLGAVETKTDRAVALGEQSVAQGTDILARLVRMEGAVTEVTTETAEGVKVVKRFSMWSQTAKDMHVDTFVKAAIRIVWPIAALWALVRVLGPEAAAKIMHMTMPGR